MAIYLISLGLVPEVVDRYVVLTKAVLESERKCERGGNKRFALVPRVQRFLVRRNFVFQPTPERPRTGGPTRRSLRCDDDEDKLRLRAAPPKSDDRTPDRVVSDQF